MRLPRREMKRARIEIVPMIDTIFFLLVCRAQHITWGSFADRAAVPGFHEEAAGPTYPAQKDTTLRNTFFTVSLAARA